MKGKVVFILTGVVSLHLVLLGGMCLSGGCKSWWGEKSPETPPPAPVPGKPVGSELPPFGPSTAAPKGDLPPFQLKDKTSGVGHAVESGSATKYTVKNGDSLWKVAKKHGISMASLAKANNIPANKGLNVGQVLNIPAGAKVVAEEKSVSTKTAKSAASGKKAVVTKSASAEPAVKSSKKAASSEDSSDSGTYVVKAGDTLAKIASKNHIKLATLAKANNIDSKKQLKVGQKIILPKSGTSVTAPEAKNAKDKKDKAEKSEKVSAKEKSKKDAKGLAAKADKTDKAAEASVATENTGSKVDSKAQEALKKLNEGTTETTDDSMEDMDKEAAKSATKADAPKAEAKPAAGGSAPETVDISEETTIQAVSARYGVKVDDLKKANPGLPSNGKLIPGMIIVLP